MVDDERSKKFQGLLVAIKHCFKDDVVFKCDSNTSYLLSLFFGLFSSPIQPFAHYVVCQRLTQSHFYMHKLDENVPYVEPTL